jgi:hypothetical protein
MSHSSASPLTTAQLGEFVDYLRRAWFGAREYIGIHLSSAPVVSIECNHSEDDIIEVDVTVYEYPRYGVEEPCDKLSDYEPPLSRIASLLEGAVVQTFDTASSPLVFEYNDLLSRGDVAVYSLDMEMRDFPAGNPEELEA